MVAVSVLMVMATRESLRFSCIFSVFGFRDKPMEQMLHETRMYAMRFVVLGALLLLFCSVYSLAFYAFATAGNIG